MYQTVNNVRKLLTDDEKVIRDAEEAKVASDYADYVANHKYKDDRASSYPTIGEQLDKIYHEGIDEWKKVIKAVKDKYPKPD